MKVRFFGRFVDPSLTLLPTKTPAGRYGTMTNLSNGTPQTSLPVSDMESGRRQDSGVKSTLTAKEAILHPKRLEALGQCDTPMYNYHRYSLLRDFGQCKGRNSGMLVMPLFLLFVFGLIWQLVFLFADNGEYLRESIEEWDGLINPLWIPVAFLLVFRLSRAAIRFWDSRAAMGHIISACRDTFSIVAVALNAPRRHYLTHSPHDLLDKYARWIAVLPIAVKNFLRDKMDATSKGWDEIEMDAHRLKEVQHLLNPDEAQQFLSANHPVLLVLDRLHELTYDMCLAADPNIQANLYLIVNTNISGLSMAFGTMEKIAKTPLPFVYVGYLRTFLVLYLAIFNMYTVAHYGWQGLVILIAVNWAMLGIEAASVECERPFGWSMNHLPLAGLSMVIAEDIVQIMDETGSDPSSVQKSAQ